MEEESDEPQNTIDELIYVSLDKLDLNQKNQVQALLPKEGKKKQKNKNKYAFTCRNRVVIVI